MKLDELRPHWQTYRAAGKEDYLSQEELYDLLPVETVSRPWRILMTTTRYVAVYGFLLFCCQSC